MSELIKYLPEFESGILRNRVLKEWVAKNRKYFFLLKNTSHRVLAFYYSLLLMLSIIGTVN